MAKASTASGGRYTEFGASGLKQYAGYVREEWMAELVGKKGQLILRQMRDNDAIIGAIFFAVEMLLRGVTFHVEGLSDSSDDEQSADFIESCIGDMEGSWAGFLAEALTFLLYGWDVHEIVYKMRKGRTGDPKTNSTYDDGMIGWRKLAGRGQETLLHWIFDESGEATHLVQLLPTGGPLLQVPLSKCLHFRTTPYKSNPEGRSIIRNAYTSWYYKKVIQEIEAIGVSRDLTGLTMVGVPPKWTLAQANADDKAAYQTAVKMARDIARNQQEGIVYPLMWDKEGKNQLFEISLLSTGGRRQFATTEIIGRYDQNIAATVLADFITLGTGGGSRSQGTGAQSKNKTDVFSVALIAFLDIITSEFNRKAIPDLLFLNNMKGQVMLKHGDIQRRDLTELATYIQDTALAGVLVPDDALEAHIREEGGLPDKDPTTERTPVDPAAADDEDEEDETDPKTGVKNTTAKPKAPGGGKNGGKKPAGGKGGANDGTGKPLASKAAKFTTRRQQRRAL